MFLYFASSVSSSIEMFFLRCRFNCNVTDIMLMNVDLLTRQREGTENKNNENKKKKTRVVI